MIFKNTIYFGTKDKKEIVEKILNYLNYETFLFGPNEFDYNFNNNFCNSNTETRINRLIKNQLYRKTPIVFLFNENVDFNNLSMLDLFNGAQIYKIYCLSFSDKFKYDHKFFTIKDLMDFIDNSKMKKNYIEKKKITENFYLDQIKKPSFIKIIGNNKSLTKKFMNYLNIMNFIYSDQNYYDKTYNDIDKLYIGVQENINVKKLIIIDHSLINLNDSILLRLIKDSEKFNAFIIVNTYNKHFLDEGIDLMGYTFCKSKDVMANYCQKMNYQFDESLENIVIFENKICKFKNKILNIVEKTKIDLIKFDFSIITHKCNILIVGNRQSGKSTLASDLKNKIKHELNIYDEQNYNFEISKTNIVTSQNINSLSLIYCIDYLLMFKDDNERIVNDLYQFVKNDISLNNFKNLLNSLDKYVCLVYEKSSGKFYYYKSDIYSDWEIIDDEKIIYKYIFVNSIKTI